MEILETTCNTCGAVTETKKYSKRTRTKEVFQWSYRNINTGNWLSVRRLLTEKEANRQFDDCEIIKISGPYEVPI